jgi:hypothetical protein
MFGHESRPPIDNLFHNEMTEIDTDLSTYLANHQQRMTEALKTANENIVTRLLENPVEATGIAQKFVLLLVKHMI